MTVDTTTAPEQREWRAVAGRQAGAFSRFELLVALRYLRSRRSDSFISIIAGFSFLGIALGVAVLIVVMSVMNGFREELLGKIIGLQGHLLVQGIDGRLTDFDALAQRVRGVPGVTRVAPIVDGEVLASGTAGSTGSLVRGIRPEDLKTLTVVSSTLSDTQVPEGLRNLTTPPDLQDQTGPEWDAHRAKILERFQGGDAVIIGQGLADRLGLLLGDSIKVTSPNGAQTAFGTVPRSQSYRIVGFFRMGMSEYDSRVVFMPLAAAQEFFNLENGVSALEVLVSKPEEVKFIRTPIYDAIGIPVNIVDWQQLNNSFFEALKVERNVMFIILTCIILVAALNVISGLIMFVKDKGHDIAILRTMGAARGAIMRIFFIAGAAIGVFGTLGGFLLGVLFCANIESLRQLLSKMTGTVIFDPTVYFLTRLPAKLDPAEVTVVVLISLTLSFLATLYPAWRAARLDPVDALRYE